MREGERACGTCPARGPVVAADAGEWGAGRAGLECGRGGGPQALDELLGPAPEGDAVVPFAVTPELDRGPALPFHGWR